MAIAEQRGDVMSEAGRLGMLHVLHFRGGASKADPDYAMRCRTLAGTIEYPVAIALAHSNLNWSSQHLMGGAATRKIGGLTNCSCQAFDRSLS
ncbi:MAG: hypothetical protein ACXU8R_18655 [Xanthobacteraceae bacterium]